MTEDFSKYSVLILAAGVGNRLRPLTDSIPKPMVPFGGKPLLEHTITLLRGQGFRNFVMNVHHLPEKITDHFGNGQKFGVNIAYSDESKELLETAGAIRKAASRLSDTFVLLYGDHMHAFDFRDVIRFHNSVEALGTLVLKTSDLPQNGDIAEIDLAAGRIIRWYARPHRVAEFSDGLYLNTGFCVFSKKIVEHIPEGRPVKLDAEVIPGLVAQGAPFYGFPTAEEILDINTPEKYEIAKQWHLARHK